jgi:MOSC domain-containing protein YiiM
LHLVSARVISVNVGTPRTVDTGKREVATAIWKAPVAGRVPVRGVNLAGDDQADRSVHGGPDKAVYAYASEDTAFWEDVLGRDLGPGAFGENLTTAGIDVSGAVLGERWRIGSALLQVRQTRVPCFKLGLRFEDKKMVRRFGDASRPGAYLMILEEGDVGAGDAIEVVHRPAHGVTSALMSDALLKDHGLLVRLLEAGDDLMPEWRAWIAERLAS